MPARPYALRLLVVAALLVGGDATATAQVPARRAWDVPGVGLTEALRLIEATRAEAAARGVAASVAVVDARGDLIALARMPGAAAATVDAAIGTAMVASIYSQSSDAQSRRYNAPIAHGLDEGTGGRLRFAPGGRLILRDGVPIGALSAAGAATPADDDALVRAVLGSASDGAGASPPRPPDR